MVKQKPDSKKVQELKHQARRRSITEGIFASAKTSFGDHYVAPFAIAINTSSSLVALLTAINGLLGPLSQIFSSRLIEKHSRKKIILKAVFYEALMWLPFVAIAFLFYKGIIVNLIPILLLLSFAFYMIFLNITTPAWFSWMGDIVDEKNRGRYFSRRNLLTGFVSIIIAVSAAFFLDYFKRNNWIMQGFIILFLLALIFRLMCLRSFKKQYEPKIKLKKGYYFSFWDFVKNSPKNNFGRLSLFRFFFTFACAVSSPLLAVYLLRHLNFSYTIYMIIIFSGTVFSLTTLMLWGKLTDRYGNYRILCVVCILIPIIPILWILNPNPIYLILVPSAINGIAWAGINLTEKNFIYDNVHQQKRGLAVSYYNMFWGLGVFLGAITSALLIKFLTIKIIEPIVAIFIIGSLARMITVFWWLPKMKEIKRKQKIGSLDKFGTVILKEAKPTLLEEAHEIMSIKKYLNTK